MSKRAWLWLIVIVAGIGGLATWYFLSDDFQPTKPNATQAATTQPTRISKDKDGQTLIMISPEEQVHSGITVQPLAALSYQPELMAYGTLQEDPAHSIVVRAAFAGSLRTVQDRPWPNLGDTLPEGLVQVGLIEPRYTPVEHLDVISKLSLAQADVSTATSALAAIRAEYEADVKLNGQDKNVSDRALRDARAKMDEQSAKLQAAQETVALLKSTLAMTGGEGSGASSSMPLTLQGGCQVVEVGAHPGETVDAAQMLLRVARFDTLLATVALPAGKSVDPASFTARVVVLGNEDHPLKVEKMSIAPAVDTRTLGQTLLIQVATPGLGLRPGGAVTAIFTSSGKPEEGVLVPRDAVVWHDGKAWVYVQSPSANDKFLRREVPTNRPVKEGWFVTPGFSSKDHIVLQGAQQLLSEEFKPIIPSFVDPDG